MALGAEDAEKLKRMPHLRPWQRFIARVIIIMALPFVAFACGLAAMKWRIWAGKIFLVKEANNHGRG